MDVSVFPIGPLASNMYILDTGSNIIIIDPSVSPEKLGHSRLPSKVSHILITHGHFDHMNAVDEWKGSFPGSKVYISPEDLPAMKDPVVNGSRIFLDPLVYDCEPEDIFKTDIPNLTVIRTPGHTAGGVCLLFEEGGQKIVFTGDTLFAGSCGRTDLYGGDESLMLSSLSTLKELDPDTVVYPGHGPSTTIAEELISNPFFNL